MVKGYSIAYSPPQLIYILRRVIKQYGHGSSPEAVIRHLEQGVDHIESNLMNTYSHQFRRSS